MILSQELCCQQVLMTHRTLFLCALAYSYLALDLPISGTYLSFEYVTVINSEMWTLASRIDEFMLMFQVFIQQIFTEAVMFSKISFAVLRQLWSSVYFVLGEVSIFYSDIMVIWCRFVHWPTFVNILDF